MANEYQVKYLLKYHPKCHHKLKICLPSTFMWEVQDKEEEAGEEITSQMEPHLEITSSLFQEHNKTMTMCLNYNVGDVVWQDI